MYLRSNLRTLPSKKEIHFKCTFRVVSNGSQVFQVVISKQIKNQNQKQNHPNLQGILIETFILHFILQKLFFFPQILLMPAGNI